MDRTDHEAIKPVAVIPNAVVMVESEAVQIRIPTMSSIGAVSPEREAVRSHREFNGLDCAYPLKEGRIQALRNRTISSVVWRARRDSNPRHPGSKPGTLSN